MKESPPTRAEAIRLMSENPNLIRRPILIKGSEMKHDMKDMKGMKGMDHSPAIP